MEKNEKNEKNDYRVEKDSIGAKDVPENVYYGVQSLRAAENFHITGLTMHPEFINSLAYIKKAAAITNCEAGLLDKKIAAAIVKACDEIIDGRLHDYFIVDPIQGGAGTSMNMNANEVIANRAIDILGGTKGDYSLVHPNDHVNYSQSTNDVIPTAGKMTALRLLKNLKAELFKLHEALIAKAKEFDHVIKMGRTQMQDAVPIRLGQEFQAYADAIMRDVRRMDKAMDEMRSLNMGGTAVGTGINADELYLKRIVPNLSEISDMEFVQAFDLIDATQNLDPFVSVSGAVKACAVTLSKMANDLRLMSSGPRAGFFSGGVLHVRSTCGPVGAARLRADPGRPLFCAHVSGEHLHPPGQHIVFGSADLAVASCDLHGGGHVLHPQLERLLFGFSGGLFNAGAAPGRAGALLCAPGQKSFSALPSGDLPGPGGHHGGAVRQLQHHRDPGDGGTAVHGGHPQRLVHRLLFCRGHRGAAVSVPNRALLHPPLSGAVKGSFVRRAGAGPKVLPLFFPLRPLFGLPVRSARRGNEDGPGIFEAVCSGKLPAPFDV